MPYSSNVPFSVAADIYRRMPVDISRVVKRELESLGVTLEKWAKDAAPKDTTLMSESIRHDVRDLTGGVWSLIISSSVPGAENALEFGRRPGGKPPFEKILGWVQRRKIEEAARTTDVIRGPKKVRTIRAVGKKIGGAFRAGKRKTMGGAKFGSKITPSVHERLDAVTREFSMTSAEDVRAAYKIRQKIASRGTRAPRIFTRVIEDTEVIQQATFDSIEEQIAELF